MWMRNKPAEVTALLIDGANCYETCRKLGYQLDYGKVYKYFNPQQAMYFTALPEKDINNPNNIFKMIDYINFNGYTVISKPMKTFNNDGVITRKGNMDVEIVVHINKAARWANHIVLFSGDGDFRLAVEDVQHQGVKVTVVSALTNVKHGDVMIADELRRQANTFIDMGAVSIRTEWEWKNNRRAFLEGS